jgi:hypothetical protein
MRSDVEVQQENAVERVLNHALVSQLVLASRKAAGR